MFGGFPLIEDLTRCKDPLMVTLGEIRNPWARAGRDQEAVVAFEGAGVKRLLLSLARLEPVE